MHGGDGVELVVTCLEHGRATCDTLVTVHGMPETQQYHLTRQRNLLDCIAGTLGPSQALINYFLSGAI